MVDMVASAFLILRINILLFATYPFKKMAGLSKKKHKEGRLYFVVWHTNQTNKRQVTS